MGVYQKYRDENGKKTGPWFCKYPVDRDRNGVTIYKIKKIGTKKQADRFYAMKTAEFNESQLFGPPPVEKEKWLFENIADYVMNLPTMKSKASYDTDLHRLKRLKAHFKDWFAEDIKAGDIEKYRELRLASESHTGKHISPGTVNREMALLRRIFNLAMRDDLVQKNPCFKIGKLDEGGGRDRVISAEEFASLVGEMKWPASGITRLAWYTGMRLGEILGLEWPRVNLQEKWISLHAKHTKTRKARKVYLVPEALAVLEYATKFRSLKFQNVFLKSDGKPVKDIRSSFEAACQRAGIENLHFHDLRHCFTTNMRRAGVHESVIMAMTGHRTRAMFDHYNNVDENDVKLALNLFSDFLGAAPKNKGPLLAP